MENPGLFTAHSFTPVDIRHQYEGKDKGIRMSITTPRRSARQRHTDPPQLDMPTFQASLPRPRPRRKRTAVFGYDHVSVITLLLSLLAILPFANAAFIEFENCLETGIKTSNRLQFTPLFVWADFENNNPRHNLNITIYGNVSGSEIQGDFPPPNSEKWHDPNVTFGKIVDLSPNTPTLTTLFSNYQVLTYTAYNANASQFCLSTVNAACPIAPVWNETNPRKFPGFTVGHDFRRSYSMATFATTVRVDSGDADAHHLACVSASITPDLGSTLSDTFTYVPAALLAMVAIATVFAATWSPWGTLELFKWSSNYGRDEDLLRLVTPGFGDCLQYIQFIVLAGSLNLDYPGFYQPVVSKGAWSLLLFNESLVSHGKGYQSLVDGIYVTNGTYGISRLGQLVGMSEEKDIWAGMAVWLLGLVVAVVLICQLGFLIRFLYRALTNTQESDHTSKNWPFTIGNIVRLVYNFFLLPIITLSLFQLVVGSKSPPSVVACAVILILGVLIFAIWIFWFIFSTRPRAHLFDDLPTLLTYGPLYNTYSDGAAPFAFIPVLLNLMRGIAIGAIQPSGIAQLVLLAISEVILILTLHAFRPFQSNTSMNAYHTFFSVIRLTTSLLMIAFVPTLDVPESSKGWIGYAILLLHAIVLVFGFFMNALQTIIEVAARLAGAGNETRGGLTAVFGIRQLSKRTHRRGNTRTSLNSNATMLPHMDDAKGRTRSPSGSSAVLLNQHLPSSHRGSVGFDQYSQGGDYSTYSATSPGTPATNATPFSFMNGGSAPNSRRPTMGTTMENTDPSYNYYRKPRERRPTIDPAVAVTQNRESKASSDVTNTPYADSLEQAEFGDAGEGPSSWSPNRNSITPAYLRMHRDDSDPNLERRKNTDYTFRESDLYYGIRGPLSSQGPTRKLKTGPADPMGPVSSATGWFNKIFGGVRKEKSKGFEVVRSTRLPPQMMPLDEDDETPAVALHPYKDSPDTPSDNNNSPDRPAPGRVIDGQDDVDSDDDVQTPKVTDAPPLLGPIETGGGIELPSRIGSRASRVSRQTDVPGRVPTLPRKSSKRPKSTDKAILEDSRLPTILSGGSEVSNGAPRGMAVPMPPPNQNLHPNPAGFPARLPFGSSEPSPSPERSPGESTTSSYIPNDANSDLIQLGPRSDLPPPQIIQTGTQRPPSTGYVHQHRAYESIHDGVYGANDHLEASAEFVNGRSRSISTNHSEGSQRTR